MCSVTDNNLYCIDMKPVVTVLLSIFVMIAEVRAQNEISRSTSIYNEEGKLQMIISYDAARKSRTYTEFYPDGKVYAKRSFSVVDKGEFIDGEDITYFNDGSIKHYKLWKNALPEGRAYSNHENGKLEHEEYYSGKFKTGTWRYYDKTGGLVKEIQFAEKKNPWNDKNQEAVIRHYQSGKLSHTEVYRQGKIVGSDKKVAPAAITSKKGPFKHDPALLDGAQLFSMKCAVCHSFDKDGYGPSLKGVTTRRKPEWLHQMITDGMKLVEAGDQDAVALYEKYFKAKHLKMDYLTKKQVEAIVAYLATND